MQGRTVAVRWFGASFIATLAVLTLIFLSRHENVAAPQPRVSETLGAARRIAPPTGGAPVGPEAPATFEDVLRAADQLVRAGVMPAPNSLQESLIAADMMIRAGVLDVPPTLEETLIAADQLARAGAIPSDGNAWENADALWMLGFVDPPVRADAPMSEVLAAVQQLDALVQYDAGVNAPPPPDAPVAPMAPAPTNTPAPPPPPAKTPAPAPPPLDPGDGWWDDGFTAQVFAIVNQQRAARGLGTLSVEPRLVSSARAYAKLLADNEWFSHTGPDGSTLVSRVEAAGFPFTVQVGEVLAWGSNGWKPGEIVDAWLDSPSHRDQLLGPYTRAGAACFFTEENNLSVRCVMDFAG